MCEKVKRDFPFPLADRLQYEERLRYGLEALTNQEFGTEFAAVWTGEIRPPKKGERYLSGAIIEAYYARQDLSRNYPIARLVKVEKKTVVTYRELEEE